MRPPVQFLEFTLDPANAQLRRGTQVIPLRPKALAVLAYLVDRPGQLVTKQELLDAIWADTAVGEWVLTTNIKELRQALDDDRRQPRIIETAHRHGYRFIAGIRRQAAGESREIFREAEGIDQTETSVIGRDRELTELGSWLRGALARKRQVGFIAGEAGIGKTTLVDAFLNALSTVDGGLWTARGQCIEQHGAGEPYLPVLEALGRLCAGSAGTDVRTLLQRHAPSWLIQLPGVLAAEEIEGLQRQLGGPTQERMLREAAAFVAALTVPLVLVLEDLHWADYATLDLVAMLAQRRDPAPLLVIGTYRPVDVVVRQHPLKQVHQELQARRSCRDLWLNPLNKEAVGAYVEARWPGLTGATDLARAVHRHTDGNPLFMVGFADYLASEGSVAQRDGQWTLTTDIEQVGARVPEGLGQMIAAQIDRLDAADRDLLEAGAVVGQAFSSTAVARALGADAVEVDARLARLARNEQLVRAAGESAWPDGTVAGAYELVHSLHQRVLYDRLAPAVRRRMHERIATGLEKGHGDHAAEIAAELAFHFEAGGDPDRAARYLEDAAARAVRRGANREAAALLKHGLALLDALPRSPERTLGTIRLSLALGQSLQARGCAGPDIEQAYQRARALAQETNDVAQLFQSVGVLNGLYVAQARFDRAREMASQLEDLMVRVPFPAFVFTAHLLIGMVEYHGGELASARSHLNAALACEEVVQPVYPVDLRVVAFNYAALTLIHQGFADQAAGRNREAATRAAAVGSPFDRGNVAQVACYLHLFRRDPEALARAAREAWAVGDEYGLPTIAAVGAMAQGRVLVANGEPAAGIAAVRDGIARYRATGQAVGLPALLASLAEAYAEAGETEQALLAVAEARALVETTHERRYEAELYRLEGEVRSARRESDAAERCFRRALEIARPQGARWWELRATVSLARLQLRQGRRAAAHRALAAIVSAITEGADTADVRDAHALMAGRAPR